jgi:hypothetical protein
VYLKAYWNIIKSQNIFHTVKEFHHKRTKVYFCLIRGGGTGAEKREEERAAAAAAAAAKKKAEEMAAAAAAAAAAVAAKQVRKSSLDYHALHRLAPASVFLLQIRTLHDPCRSSA